MTIGVTFNCENHNEVLLLTTFWDLISDEEIATSIPIYYHFDWMMDEIGARAQDVIDYLDSEGDGGKIHPRLRAFAESYKLLPKEQP